MRSALQYEGKRVIVTGAAAGIGAATAQLLIELGAEVHVIADAKPAYTGYASASVCVDDAQVAETVQKIGHVVNALFACAGPISVATVAPLMLDDSAIVSIGSRAEASVRSNAVVPNDATEEDVAWALVFLNSARAAAIDGATLVLSRRR